MKLNCFYKNYLIRFHNEFRSFMNQRRPSMFLQEGDSLPWGFPRYHRDALPPHI